jgi:hypothetical protein
MRVQILVASLAVVLGTATVGCKSASKYAWWDTADKAETADTALAATEPLLPSQIAKQAEGGQAAPYTPGQMAQGAMPSSYPSTGAPGYPIGGMAPAYQPPPQSVAATSPMADSGMSNLGSIAPPYDPSAVPPAANVALTTAPAPTESTAERYASATSAGPITPTAPMESGPSVASSPYEASAGSRYGNYSAANAAPSATSSYGMESAPINTAVPVAPAAGDRYTATTTPASSAEMNPLEEKSPAPDTMTAASPYRPGGTATYPSSAPAYEVATRPGYEASSSTNEASVPNAAAPGQTTTPAAPQGSRYW